MAIAFGDLRDSPRVDGSIPSLATISNSMICNGFRVSPADYPWPSMVDPRTIGKWVDGAGLARTQHLEERDHLERSAMLHQLRIEACRTGVHHFPK